MDPDVVQWLWAYAMMLRIDPNNKAVMKITSTVLTSMVTGVDRKSVKNDMVCGQQWRRGAKEVP